MKLILTLVAFIMLTGVAVADTYTFNTTTDQEAALVENLAIINVARTASNPPLATLTKTEYMELVFQNVVGQYTRLSKERKEAEIKLSYESATQADKDTIDGILGLP